MYITHMIADRLRSQQAIAGSQAIWQAASIVFVLVRSLLLWPNNLSMISRLHDLLVLIFSMVLKDQRNPYCIIDAGEGFGAKKLPTCYDLALFFANHTSEEPIT